MFRPHLFLFLLCIQNIYALNILVIFSLPLRSHYMAVKPFFDKLADVGHHVTVVNNFPDVDPANKIRYIDLQDDDSASKRMFPLSYYEEMNPRTLHLFNLYRHIALSPGIIKDDCDTLLTNKNVTSHLASKNSYDLVFVEQFMSDCALVYAAANYDAPVIGIMSHVLLPWHYSRLGLPFNYATDAFYFATSDYLHPFLHKLESFIMDKIFNILGKWYIQRSIYESFAEHMPGYKFNVEEIARDRIKMMFSYQNFVLTGGRVLAPQLLEIGGLHIGTPKPLPQDIETFINDSKDGIIYFSLGSNLKASSMTDKKLNVFLKSFEKISQNIIWKWENDSYSFNNNRILSKPWFTQLDVLCHPKVIAFISHGGMLGTSEAAYCGVPMIAIPFFGDQFSNAVFISKSGLGRVLLFPEINEDNLLNALKDVTSEKMQKKAKEISTYWRDRPMSVMDSAIYWTEHVARNDQSPPPLPSKYTTQFENLLLDGAVAFLFFVIIFVVFIVFKLIWTLLIMLSGVALCKNKYKVD